MEYKTFFIIFFSVLVAEMGDKTQLATFGFATNADTSKFMIFFASALALVVSSAIAVVAGEFIIDFIGENSLKILSGVIFIIIGLWTLWGVKL
jgi:putative Ca2+/H+ antiporter (TMEM165/GDT1 family)